MVDPYNVEITSTLAALEFKGKKILEKVAFCHGILTNQLCSSIFQFIIECIAKGSAFKKYG